MLVQLKKFSPDWEMHATKAVEFETCLFSDWVDALSSELNLS